MDNLFIARQPIYDRNKGVMGYELLYRDDEINRANINDADQASCSTILNSFMHIGIENIVGSSLAFINLPRGFVLNGALTPMFKAQSVLEILEDVAPDKETIAGLQRLKNDGYKIALDDFVYRESLIPFIKLADFIKIDVIALSKPAIEQQLKALKPYLGKPFNIKLIAEKVETHEMHQFCSRCEFDYFQGYFFSHPEMLERKSLPGNKVVILNLINRLQDPEISAEELENILIQDITLSYKLLRYINSATFSLRREIDSIKDAITILGTRNLKNWISLILMSNLIDTKPTELIVTGMVRGKMCELLAEIHHPEIKHQMFIIGLFSVLDALMDQPLVELLDTVILSIPIKLALLDQSGIQGEIYSHVLKYEKCDWHELQNSDIDAPQYIQSYLSAVHWTDQNIKGLLAH
ncbi:Predicted signal transduction protein [hydrothermal vent metagenome]|uniref:Predicted signal transduction protein n=1 Tax=hydrothermal vent metagenome TaxID=652676 RepID=A0A3B0XEU3_9ZZZZ